MDSTSNMIRADFTIYRGNERLLEASELQFSKQSVTAIVGLSGCGKTLTAYAMLNLLKIAAPSLHSKVNIRFSNLPKDFRVSYVPQGTGLHLQPTVLIRNQMYNLVCGKGGLQPELYSDENAASLLRQMCISSPEELFRLTPTEISGGMLQRVLLAIAIMRQPHFMVLDEPTTSLDGYARAGVYKAILDCSDKHGTAVLLLSHNPRDISVLADQVLCIEDGVIVPGPEPKLFRDRIFHPNHRLPIKVSNQPIWKTNNLTVSLKPKQIYSPLSFRRPKTIRKTFSIDPFSIKLHASDSLGLIGESGCGKTTLLRAMARLIKSNSGTITLDSIDLTTQSSRNLRRMRKYFQVVFQDSSRSLNPFHTVEDTLYEPYIIHGETSPTPKALRDLLVRVHLPENILTHQVTELSHGQRQRLSLLRVLTGFPSMKVLMIDEPFAGLDQSAAQAVIDLWRERAENLVTIIASHDIEWIQGLCNQVHVMRNGSHIETCSNEKQEFQTKYANRFWQAGLIADRASLLKLNSLPL